MKGYRLKALFWMAFTVYFFIGLLPVLELAADSVMNGGLLDPGAYLGMLSGSRHVTLILNSLRLAFATTAVSVAVGFPLAFLLYKTDMPLARLFKVAFAASLIIPPYIAAIAWIDLLGDAGSMNNALSSLLGLNGLPFTIYGFWGSVFVLTMFSFPLVALLAGGALNSIGRTLEEAAVVAGGRLKAVTHVALPLACNGLLFGALLVFTNALFDFGVTSFLRYDTFTLDVYSRLASFYDLRSATAYSLVLMAAAFGFVLFYRRALGGRVFTSIFSASDSKPFELGALKVPAVFFASSLLSLSLLAPLASLFFASLYSGGEMTYLSNYRLVLKLGSGNIANSLTYSAAASVVAVALGFTLAYSVGKAGRIAGLVESALLLPFMMPGTVYGLGLIAIWNRPWLPIYNTYMMLIFASVGRYAIIPYKAGEMALQKIGPSLTEAASLTGAPLHRTLWKITVPLAAPAIASSLTLTYLLCMTELNTSLVVYPPGEATLPISLFILQHAGPPGLVAALSLTLILTAMLPVIIISALWRRRGKDSA